MDRARIKTFLLLLLLAVNLVFLSIIVIDRVQEAQLWSETRSELVQALERLGIAIDPAAIPDCAPQPILFVERDIHAETQAVSAILGDPAEGTHEGGGIYRWTGRYGDGEIRQASFWFRLSGEGRSGTDTGEFLAQMGLTARWTGARALPYGHWETYILTVDDLPVVNSQVNFRIAGGALQEVGGTALWGRKQRYHAGHQLDVTTALVTLAGYLQETSAVSRFERVEMGYDLSEGPGIFELRPVWVVETDGGTFSIDRQSGEIR